MTVMNEAEMLLVVAIVVLVLLIVREIILFYTNTPQQGERIEGFKDDVVYFKSEIDNDTYLVQNLKDKKEASNLLAEIKRRLKKLMSFVCEYNKDYCRHLGKLKINDLAETHGENRYNSHTINKTRINLCLRCRSCGDTLEDINTLMFVAIHEMAHVICDIYGHTKKFWEIMKELLQLAIQNGLYEYQDYRQMPKKYCNTMISDTPLH